MITSFPKYFWISPRSWSMWICCSMCQWFREWITWFVLYLGISHSCTNNSFNMIVCWTCWAYILWKLWRIFVNDLKITWKHTIASIIYLAFLIWTFSIWYWLNLSWIHNYFVVMICCKWICLGKVISIHPLACAFLRFHLLGVLIIYVTIFDQIIYLKYLITTLGFNVYWLSNCKGI